MRLTWLALAMVVCLPFTGHAASKPTPEKVAPMTKEDMDRELARLGFPGERWSAEPFELLAEDAPPGALDDIRCFRLIDKQHEPARDRPTVVWRPAAVVGKKVLVGPSPELFGALLAAAAVFDQPSAFSDMLLLQMHGFALDGHDGHELDTGALTRQPDALVIKGTISPSPAGVGGGQYETTAPRKGPVQFRVTNPMDGLL